MSDQAPKLPANPAPQSLSDCGPTLYQEAPAKGDGRGGPRLAILERLGEGGMGMVWKARDNHLGRLVAVKRPKPALVASARGRMRFLREARACAALNHPNIITVYHADEDAEGPFIEMEYVEGVSLDEEVRRAGPLDLRRTVQFGCQLCDALALAHSLGVIHRDIKPANIMLTQRGMPKLGDFGLAAAGESIPAGTMSTMDGSVLGTPFYASPEQQAGAARVDGRSDIYSLAVTLFYALTGEHPRVLRLERLPAELRPVLRKALEEKAGDRYPDVQAFERALRECLAEAAEAICPKCHGASPLGARHCTQCGAGLAGLYRTCPKCGGESRLEQRFCQQCGTNLHALDEIDQIRKALERSAKARLHEEMGRLAARGLTLAPGDAAFTEAARVAREAAERLRRLQQRLAQTPRADRAGREKILKAILELAPADSAAREELEALTGEPRPQPPPQPAAQPAAEEPPSQPQPAATPATPAAPPAPMSRRTRMRGVITLAVLLALAVYGTLLWNDASAWWRAREANTIEAYKEYLRSRPDGSKHEEALAQIKLLQDDEAWEAVQAKNTVEAFKGYLANYPQGRHAADAQYQIEQLDSGFNFSTLGTPIRRPPVKGKSPKKSKKK